MLNRKAEMDVEISQNDSDISTSQEDYESRQRVVLEIRGMTRSEAAQYEIEKRDGFGFNLRKNCIAIGRALIMREIF